MRRVTRGSRWLAPSVNCSIPRFFHGGEGELALDSSLLTVRMADKRKPKPASDGLKFGHHFSDHMLTVTWEQGRGWEAPCIRPLEPLSLHPASKVLHYAQEIYEGMKAYRGEDNRVRLFRPDLNLKRMNVSAKRACLPTFAPTELLECIKRLILVDMSWVPAAPSSLYIRPCLLGTEATLGLGPSSQALLTVLLSPVCSYYTSSAKTQPVSLLADPHYVRSFPGGCGDTKMGSNYAPTLRVQQEAMAQGCDQVLWLHGENLQISEVGSMNIFMVMKSEQGFTKLVTPSLRCGTILPGITRRSVLELASQLPNLEVEETAITLPQVLEANANGKLLEMFGTGTAATITQVGNIRFRGQDHRIASPTSGLAATFLSQLSNITRGKVDHPWVTEIDEKWGAEGKVVKTRREVGDGVSDLQLRALKGF